MHDDDGRFTPPPLGAVPRAITHSEVSGAAESVLWRELRALAVRLGELETDRTALFGHRGQPGAIQRMEQRLDGHDRAFERFDGRLTPIERLRWQVVGASTLAGTVVSIAVMLISKLW